MRASLSTGQRIKKVQHSIEMFENSLDYYLKPLILKKLNQNVKNIFTKQSSPKRETIQTTSFRIKQNIISHQNTEPINIKSLQTLPQRNVSANQNRSYILRHKKPSIHERYKQIMDYNVEEQFVELRRLMSRQKKSSSLGKRVKFLQQ